MKEVLLIYLGCSKKFQKSFKKSLLGRTRSLVYNKRNPIILFRFLEQVGSFSPIESSEGRR